MQSNGAEMLRLACIFAINSGVKVCGPVHDAVLIEARADEMDEKIDLARKCMAQASRMVLDGFEVRTDYEKVIYPARFIDPRGKKMWETICKILGISYGCKLTTY
jgi:hypothetical protein